MEGATQEAVRAQVETAMTSDPFWKLPVVKTPVAQQKMETYLDRLLSQVDLMIDLMPGFGPQGRPNSALALETYAMHQESTLTELLKDSKSSFRNAHQYAVQSTQYSLAQTYTIQLKALEVLRLQRIKKLQRLILDEDVYIALSRKRNSSRELGPSQLHQNESAKRHRGDEESVCSQEKGRSPEMAVCEVSEPDHGKGSDDHGRKEASCQTEGGGGIGTGRDQEDEFIARERLRITEPGRIYGSTDIPSLLDPHLPSRLLREEEGLIKEAKGEIVNN